MDGSRLEPGPVSAHSAASTQCAAIPRRAPCLSGKPGSANRTMPVLSVMMRMAELWGYRVHKTNPCKRTRRYRMKPKERFLTAEEMARLNAVLIRDEFRCPDVVAIVRLLMLPTSTSSKPPRGSGA